MGVAALAGGILTLAIEFNSSSLNIALERYTLPKIVLTSSGVVYAVVAGVRRKCRRRIVRGKCRIRIP